jgi:hypothetical protein
MEAAAKAAQEEAKHKKATVKSPMTTAPASQPSAEAVPIPAFTGTLGLFPTTTPEPAPTQSNAGLAL